MERTAPLSVVVVAEEMLTRVENCIRKGVGQRKDAAFLKYNGGFVKKLAAGLRGSSARTRFKLNWENAEISREEFWMPGIARRWRDVER